MFGLGLADFRESVSILFPVTADGFFLFDVVDTVVVDEEGNTVVDDNIDLVLV